MASWGATTRRRVGTAAAIVVLTAWAVGGEVISVTAGWGGNHMLELLSGLSFLSAGIFAMTREPRNRIGPLLTTYGFVWFLGYWSIFLPRVPGAILPLFTAAAGALLVHIGVAYPTGRILTRFGRTVVISTYVWSLAIALAQDVTVDRAAWHCEDLPYPCRSTLSLWPSVAANSTLGIIADASNLVILGLTATALWQRWALSDAAGRADQVPIWIAFAALGASYSAASIADLTGAPDAVVTALFELRVLAQIAAPIVIVYGLVHTQVARLARHNAELAETVQEQLDEVRASRARIVAAADAERRRVEHNLHDGAQQRLLSVILALRGAERQAELGSPDARVAIAAAREDLRTAVEELRELARGIRPSILADAGLGPAVRALAERSAVPVAELEVLDDRMDPTVEATAYFVVAESLANVAKHAKASAVTIRIQRDAGILHVLVSDDGVGGASADGSGLRGLADRVAAVGGELTVSSPPGGGTSIVAVLSDDRRAET